MKIANLIPTDNEIAIDAEMAEQRETIYADSDERALWLGPNIAGELTLAVETRHGWTGVNVGDLDTVQSIAVQLLRYVAARREREEDTIIYTEPGKRIRVSRFEDGDVHIDDQYAGESTWGATRWEDGGTVQVRRKYLHAVLMAVAAADGGSDDPR